MNKNDEIELNRNFSVIDQESVRDKIHSIRSTIRLNQLKKPKLASRSSNFDIYKNVWDRINELKVKCQSNRRLRSMDIVKYRHSKLQVILTQMLMKGYHRSFSLLFNINKERERMRQIEGPDSTRWNLVSLNDHPMLESIRNYLCALEEHQRKGNAEGIMRSVSKLINIFNDNQEDGWIVQQLVDIELKSNDNYIEDGGYLQAVGNLKAGITAYEIGNLEVAAHSLSKVFSMSYMNNWSYIDGTMMLTTCSEYLCRVYLALACNSKTPNPATMLSYLKQAHEISKETDLKDIEASCCLQLGLIFEGLGNIDMSIAYFRALYEVSTSINDSHKLGLACEAIARCYHTQAHKSEVFRYLDKFVDIAERSCDWHEYARSNLILGETYNMYDEYDKANNAFQISYFITWCLNNQPSFSKSCVLNGVAMGNKYLHVYQEHIHSNSRQAHERLSYFEACTNLVSPMIFLDKIEDKDCVNFDKRNQKIRYKEPENLELDL